MEKQAWRFQSVAQMHLNNYNNSNYVHEAKPTLHHHLVTGHQDLLAVAGLRVLQDGGARLRSCRVGHGESLKALHAVGAVIGQLDGAALCDGDWERKEKMQLFNQHQRPS